MRVRPFVAKELRRSWGDGVGDTVLYRFHCSGELESRAGPMALTTQCDRFCETGTAPGSPCS